MLKFEKLAGIIAASILALPAVAVSQVATPATVGRWEGEAQIVVDWTRQRTLPVNIAIFADDKVVGTIGDAKLVSGRLLRNRGWVSTVLQLKTDYIIEAYLDGAIIRAEAVERAQVQLPFNVRDGRLEGGINTSGWKAGGAERAVLAATMTLHRAPDMIICDSKTADCGSAPAVAKRPLP